MKQDAYPAIYALVSIQILAPSPESQIYLSGGNRKRSGSVVQTRHLALTSVSPIRDLTRTTKPQPPAKTAAVADKNTKDWLTCGAVGSEVPSLKYQTEPSLTWGRSLGILTATAPADSGISPEILICASKWMVSRLRTGLLYRKTV